MKTNIKQTVLIISLLFFFESCNQTKQNKEFVYNYVVLQKAWETNDSIYVKKWIENLNALKFADFINRMSEFASITNFCYGNFDTEGDINKRWTDEERVIIVNNVIIVNKLYLNSCLFMNKKVSFDETLFIQEKYSNEARLLSLSELNRIKNEMIRICDRKNTH